MNFTPDRVLRLALVPLALTPLVAAAVEVAPVFGDGMVLQRELPVPVWGTAAPGERVVVSFAGQRQATTAGPHGDWMVRLDALEASRRGRPMTVEGADKVAFHDVLVGEVWLCSGQSNMAGRFAPTKGHSIDPGVFRANLSGFRFNDASGWTTLDRQTQARLSRVAFHFGIELYRALDVPVGLVLRYQSGTPIQAWMPGDAAEAIRRRLDIPADWNDRVAGHAPAAQFGDKIAPIIPVAMRGVIWYQGERNAKTLTGWEYRHLLPCLIETWRELWTARAGADPRPFPFYYVQVPTQEAPGKGEWAWLRDSMRRVVDTTVNTGMAVFYDHGPGLHPPDKEPAGQRLALWALAKDYGRTGLVHSGPLLDGVRIEGDRLVLGFKHLGGGLRSASTDDRLEFFEIAGSDGVYHPAEARIVGDTVVVHSGNVPDPLHVRYLFTKPRPDPGISLLNAEGLPASPFMTDDSKPPRQGQ